MILKGKFVVDASFAVKSSDSVAVIKNSSIGASVVEVSAIGAGVCLRTGEPNLLLLNGVSIVAIVVSDISSKGITVCSLINFGFL